MSSPPGNEVDVCGRADVQVVLVDVVRAPQVTLKEFIIRDVGDPPVPGLDPEADVARGGS